MQIERRFTNDLGGAWDGIAFAAHRTDHGVIMAPEGWSRVAVDVLAQDVLARGCVPDRLRAVPEDGVPEFLWSSIPCDDAVMGDESDLRQVMDRMAGAWARRGWKAGLFASEDDARAYLDEVRCMMARQMAAPALREWAVTGIDWAYGAEVPDSPRAPGVTDSRDEPDLMEALKCADRAAAARARGAMTRSTSLRAICDIDHPQARRFIDWKLDEERKLSALIAGSRLHADRLNAVLTAAREGQGGPDMAANPALKAALRDARRALIPETYVQRALDYARQGFTAIDFPVFDADWDGEGAASVTGQQTDCVLRVTRDFMQAAQQGRDDGLWDRIADAAWATGDPALRFQDNIPAFAGGQASAHAHLNLMAFLQGGEVDHDALAHAAQLWALTLGIAGGDAIGLGPVNLGALLIAMGIAYDSDEGREVAARIASVMTGAAWVVSGRMAADIGPCADFATHRAAMLRMLRADVPSPARAQFAQALDLAQGHGLRHSQVTGIAPAGRLSLLMGWETDGIDPAYALVGFAPDPDGGHRRRIAPAVPMGLAMLGYPADAVSRIVAHATGHATLAGSPAIDHAALAGHGFGPAQIDRIEAALPDAFDIRFVFNRWTLGQDFCRNVLGIPADRLEDPGFDMLAHLGFSDGQIAQANDHVCGAMTLEGAPDLDPADLAVFDCAGTLGRQGRRRVAPEARIRQAATLQAHMSGPVPCEVDLPHTTTISAMQSLFELADELGLHECRLRREGSGLSAQSADLFDDDDEELLSEAPAQIRAQVVAERVVEKIVMGDAGRTHRQKLPQRRKGYTQKASVGGHKVYLRTGEYDDGSVGEIFIDMHKEGAGFRAMMNNFAIAVSVGLQYGVPLEEFVDAFTFTRFEPAGPVQGNDSIKNATSILDYVFRELAVSYLDRTDLAHVKPEGARFDDIGGGRDEGRRAPARPEPKSLTMLKQISSAGYLRKRLPQELMVLQGGRAALRHNQAAPCALCGGTMNDVGGVSHCEHCEDRDQGRSSR
ncbi:vitamin B12-dependent ribonucleotide reductase [Paracoccus sp. 1_MG-2023]|uniref:TSCPD domain-containing protein n=1 Tax=unclassified Paracoccus (in: a-proteobacteria) TaxID=2688777 RepID=UPI001C08AC4F|nr:MULTISPECIES: vitamin B12-dependent ribonucleotide reductase [unclassified Paracoccus (in: a-proteobacteria)]MBU2958576.1 vitamin B12-dependent ribonucleotide reductase [Paracoccus sp. C2R09]MDO6667569.1 vitamin B12-dependent ribonucleotide reductase [Paracoccus sp. 1_MG-2023]